MRQRDHGETAPLVFFDVGANQGEWTLSLVSKSESVGRKQLKIYLFEPIQTSRERLRKSLEPLFHRVDFSIESFALSDVAGVADMAVLSESGGTNSLEYDDDVADAALNFVSVEKSMIDEFCETRSIERINLAKLDTEGHDFRAISGAARLLSEGRVDVLQFEYNHRWIYARAYLKDVFDIIVNTDYVVGKVCSSGIEVYEGWHPELDRFFEANYVVVHKSALHWFDVIEGRFDESNTYA